MRTYRILNDLEVFGADVVIGGKPYGDVLMDFCGAAVWYWPAAECEGGELNALY